MTHEEHEARWELSRRYVLRVQNAERDIENIRRAERHEALLAAMTTLKPRRRSRKTSSSSTPPASWTNVAGLLGLS